MLFNEAVSALTNYNRDAGILKPEYFISRRFVMFRSVFDWVPVTYGTYINLRKIAN